MTGSGVRGLQERIAAGMDLFEIDSNGKTLAHKAASAGKDWELHLLLVIDQQSRIRDADAMHSIASLINSCDGQSRTLLHLASLAGNIWTVRYLIESWPDIPLNSVDADGRTALHLAAIGGHSLVCQALIRGPNFPHGDGVNTTIRDRHGLLASDVANQAGHSETASFLSLISGIMRTNSQSTTSRTVLPTLSDSTDLQWPTYCPGRDMAARLLRPSAYALHRAYLPPPVHHGRLHAITAATLLLWLAALLFPSLVILAAVVAAGWRPHAAALAAAAGAPTREWATGFWRGCAAAGLSLAAARSLAPPAAALGAAPPPAALAALFWLCAALMAATLAATLAADPGAVTLDHAARADALRAFLAHGAAPHGFDQVPRTFPTRPSHAPRTSLARPSHVPRTSPARPRTSPAHPFSRGRSKVRDGGQVGRRGVVAVVSVSGGGGGLGEGVGREEAADECPSTLTTAPRRGPRHTQAWQEAALPRACGGSVGRCGLAGEEGGVWDAASKGAVTQPWRGAMMHGCPAV
jgi:hypothetical protein